MGDLAATKTQGLHGGPPANTPGRGCGATAWAAAGAAMHTQLGLQGLLGEDAQPLLRRELAFQPAVGRRQGHHRVLILSRRIQDAQTEAPAARAAATEAKRTPRRGCGVPRAHPQPQFRPPCFALVRPGGLTTASSSGPQALAQRLATRTDRRFRRSQHGQCHQVPACVYPARSGALATGHRFRLKSGSPCNNNRGRDFMVDGEAAGTAWQHWIPAAISSLVMRRACHLELALFRHKSPCHQHARGTSMHEAWAPSLRSRRIVICNAIAITLQLSLPG